jgi:hypothetical protein
VRTSPTSSATPLIHVAQDAIAKARAAHDEIVDALEDADILGSAPPAQRMTWGCAIVSRRVEEDERWIADILDAESNGGLVWPSPSVIPAGSLLLQFVSEGGSSLPATPAVFAALEEANARLLGLTSMCWDAHADGLLGNDDPLPSVDVTLIPTSLRAEYPMTMPTTFRSSISAAAVPMPIVLLCAQKPPSLPR